MSNVSVQADSKLGQALREAVFRCDDAWIRDMMSVVAPLWDGLATT